MNRIVHVICEGQTELTFVQKVLVPYLTHRMVLLPAFIGNAGGARGGRVTMERLFRDAKYLLSPKDHVVTTMLDYYGLAGPWPYPETRKRTAHQKGRALEDAVSTLFEGETQGRFGRRFHPYFSMHEFEALLFASPPILARELDLAEKDILAITSPFSSVEDINCGRETAPSKRLDALCQARGRGYNKTLHGPTLAKIIGIDLLREACPHFGSWISLLERLP